MYTSTGNLRRLAPVELFFEAVERLQFLTRADFFFDIQFFPLCEISLKAVDAQIT